VVVVCHLFCMRCLGYCGCCFRSCGISCSKCPGRCRCLAPRCVRRVRTAAFGRRCGSSVGIRAGGAVSVRAVASCAIIVKVRDVKAELVFPESLLVASRTTPFVPKVRNSYGAVRGVKLENRRGDNAA
jgi:hypothetical protein